MTETQATPESSPFLIKGKNLVIASPSSISETSFCIPAVRAIRNSWPDGIITIVANPATAPLWKKVSGANHLMRLTVDDSLKPIVKRLRNSKIPFDASIAWNDSPAARAFAKYEIPQRLGYPTERLAKYLTDPIKVVRKIGPIEHQVNRYLYFVEKLGVEAFQAENFIHPKRPESEGNFRVIIAPGSDYGTAAEWPLERFAELTKKIAAFCEVAIVSSPDRSGPAIALAKALGKPKLHVKAEGAVLLNYLASSNAVVSCDNSVAHMSSFVGTPSVVLFGPNEPAWKRPLGRIHRIVRRHVPCSSCLLNKCPLDHRCMTEIQVDDVFAELKSLFADSQ